MAIMTDIMWDIETTGNPETMGVDSIGIIQIGAIKFNYETQEIGPVFDRCLALAPNRHWEESTREFWFVRNRAVLNTILARQEDPGHVMRDFQSFCVADAPEGGYRTWAKPISFDHAILTSYFRQFGLPTPGHYRLARDLNSFIAGRYGAAKHQKMEHVETSGDLHNALSDCVYQLKLLFAAANGDFGPQVIEA